MSGQGGQTLALLNSAIAQAEANTMCFVNAKAIVDNATHVSKEARIKAQEAYMVSGIVSTDNLHWFFITKGQN